jgi:dihydrofolate reductase
MADKGTMSGSAIPLTIIVAATIKNGIGKNGALPWPMIKKDMAYFASVTKRVPTGSSILENDQRRNVVIMGRKTWESIPKKFRPLKDRTNVVISSQTREQLQPIPNDVVVAASISSALHDLESRIEAGSLPPIGRAFVIGGTSIYKAALELPQTDRILLTRVSREYDCDTFFPDILKDDAGSANGQWSQVPHAAHEKFVGEAVEDGQKAYAVGDESIELDFQLHERSSA